MSKRTFTLKEIKHRIHDLDKDEKKRVVCALVGHSRVVDVCMGQVTCGRCGEILGDTLLGVMDLRESVIVGHACATCRRNYKKMGWRDTFLVDDPFVSQSF